jgi:hypothetical protein
MKDAWDTLLRVYKRVNLFRWTVARKRRAKSNDNRINMKGTDDASIAQLGIGNGNRKLCLLFRFQNHLIERTVNIHIEIRTPLSIFQSNVKCRELRIIDWVCPSPLLSRLHNFFP